MITYISLVICLIALMCTGAYVYALCKYRILKLTAEILVLKCLIPVILSSLISVDRSMNWKTIKTRSKWK